MEAATGVIETVAGSGTIGEHGGYYEGDGTPATDAFLDRPVAVYIDTYGNLLIADAGNHLLRRVDAETGVIDSISALRDRSELQAKENTIRPIRQSQKPRQNRNA